jgi:hypothetical protein
MDFHDRRVLSPPDARRRNGTCSDRVAVIPDHGSAERHESMRFEQQQFNATNVASNASSEGRHFHARHRIRDQLSFLIPHLLVTREAGAGGDRRGDNDGDPNCPPVPRRAKRRR